MGSNNLFFVHGAGDQVEVVTPMLTGSILAGVTRDSLLVLAKELGCQVSERKVSWDEWREGAADGRITEVFGCGTAAVVAWGAGVRGSFVPEAARIPGCIPACGSAGRSSTRVICR